MENLPTPKEIAPWNGSELSDSSGVLITWTDGHKSIFPYDLLRNRCPCALCQEERKSHLPVVHSGLRIEKVAAVGRYGLQFFWTDGHSTGIYTFDFLRSLCSCAECSPPGVSS